MSQTEWLGIWRQRTTDTLAAERDAFVEDLHTLKTTDVLPRYLRPDAALEQDLHCDAVEGNLLPYVLNVGCGFKPLSIGRRTREGVPVNVVGLDPLSFGIGEALTLMAASFPHLAHSRRFILPLVCEEMNAAIPPSSFDACWSENVLLDCVDPFRFLQQCARAAKSGGVVCAKFNPRIEGTLWNLKAFDGGRVVLESRLGTADVTEVRGERVEVHTMADETLMIKLRMRQHTVADAEKMMTPRLIVPGR